MVLLTLLIIMPLQLMELAEFVIMLSLILLQYRTQQDHQANMLIIVLFLPSDIHLVDIYVNTDHFSVYGQQLVYD